jgi:hypothetical protein
MIVGVPKMTTDPKLPPRPPGTGPGISMGDLQDRLQRAEKEIEDLKKRIAKLEK